MQKCWIEEVRERRVSHASLPWKIYANIPYPSPGAYYVLYMYVLFPHLSPLSVSLSLFDF